MKEKDQPRLLTMKMLEAGMADQLTAAGSLEEVYRLLTAWSGVGAFLGYQMAIDLNYSTVIDHDEDEFVVERKALSRFEDRYTTVTEITNDGYSSNKTTPSDRFHRVEKGLLDLPLTCRQM